MSERFFEYSMKCPNCGFISHSADGFETDDWVEVFVFSGYSPKSAGNNYHGYTCPNCQKALDIDSLFLKKLVFPESIDQVKSYLFRMLPYVLERKGIYDHGWDPDVETAVQRYAALFPEDQELYRLNQLYYLAYHNPRKLVKFEPSPGTRIITRDMIVYPETLQKVYLPDGLSKIGDQTFTNCSGLRDIFLPKSVKTIGVSAFENCTCLKSVHSSDSLLTIKDRAFAGCALLDRFFFPDGILEIGYQSFLKCSRLKKIYIPAGCRKIGEDAFGDCPDIIIHGKPGTIAENYAKTHSLSFVADE